MIDDASLPSRRTIGKQLLGMAAASVAVAPALAQIASAQQTQPVELPPASAPAGGGRGGRGGGRGGPGGGRGPGAAPGSVTFNTVLNKLKAGKQVFSNTITEPDLEAAKRACEGQDFIWIEMQH